MYSLGVYLTTHYHKRDWATVDKATLLRIFYFSGKATKYTETIHNIWYIIYSIDP